MQPCHPRAAAPRAPGAALRRPAGCYRSQPTQPCEPGAAGAPVEIHQSLARRAAQTSPLCRRAGRHHTQLRAACEAHARRPRAARPCKLSGAGVACRVGWRAADRWRGSPCCCTCRPFYKVDGDAVRALIPNLAPEALGRLSMATRACRHSCWARRPGSPAEARRAGSPRRRCSATSACRRGCWRSRRRRPPSPGAPPSAARPRWPRRRERAQAPAAPDASSCVV